MKNKLYVLIDQNLDPIYGAVQGSHAVAEWLLKHYKIDKQGDPKWLWNNDYLIYLKANLEDIQNNYLKHYNNDETLFYEPDLNNKLTSIAIHEDSIIDNSLKRKIKNLKLWGT